MSKSCETFVLELPLRVDSVANRTLMVRFEAARQLYNACLGEALRRLERMRESAEWIEAKKLPKEERRRVIKDLVRAFGFNVYAIESYGTACKNACWIGDHLDAHVSQKVAGRAFDAARQYSFSKRGRPRFKSRFKSVE